MAQQQQDIDALKRRGRRRLVGAVALVLLAIIVLPMVFDQEPRSPTPAVSIRIPGEDETPFKPKPKATVVESQAPPVAQSPEKKPAPSEAQYVVPVGAFANPDPVLAKLAGAKIPYYTEAAQGKLTRVRAGPFASREAAESVAKKLKGLGLEPSTA